MKTLHPSSLSDFNDCSRRAVARSFPGVVLKAGYELRQTKNRVASAVGSGAHASIACVLKARKNGAPGIETEYAVSVGMDEFEKREAKGLHWDDVSQSKADIKHQIRSITLACIPAFKNTETLHVEQTLQSFTHVDGWMIEGTPDHIHTGGIQDWKSGRDGAFSLQLTVYKDLAAAHGLLPEKADGLDVVRIPRTHPDKPQQPAIIKAAHYMPTSAKGAITRISSMVDRFEREGDKEIFTPNPMSNICNNKDCPVWGTEFCDSWKDKEKE